MREIRDGKRERESKKGVKKTSKKYKRGQDIDKQQRAEERQEEGTDFCLQ